MSGLLARWTGIAAILAGALCLVAGAPDPAPLAPPARDYPLDTCVVSGQTLGSMGKPVVIQHNGREVRLCCAGCVDVFRNDPAKYLAILDAASRGGAPLEGHGRRDPAAAPPARGGEGGREHPTPKSPVDSPKKPAAYYCPMHPTYVTDRPGDCPICNMTLVPMKQGDSVASSVAGYATLTIPKERLQLIGVRTALVEKKKATKTVRVAGKVERNEKALSAVNLKVGGWIEDLFVKSAGEAVRAGEPLFTLYSPELLEAQKNYLLAREFLTKLDAAATPESRAFAEQALRSAKDRLLLWDMAEEQLRAIEQKREPLARVPILSKTAGVVTRRNVVLGAYAEPGRDLFEITDLSTVWILADVYEYEIPEIRVGQEATAHLSALPGEFVTGKVTYLYPYLNESTRTARVRIEVPNAEGKLKPGMFAAVSLAVDLGEPIVIDDQAVLDSGTRQIVFVDLGGGRIEPRSVTLGARGDGFIVVLQGIQPGERVVTSGNFLIDSESRLQAALLGGSPGGGAGGEHSGHAK
jgi:Cu(I)/Ag(I) efflux system membrane fusion protein